MKCFKCQNYIGNSAKTLKCIECSGVCHLGCIKNISESEYEFLVSSASSWKCDLCLSKKHKRDDDTPVTPSGQKSVKLSKDNESESDSSNNSSANIAVKTVCFSCSKGFSRNAHRAKCNNCYNVFHFKETCLPISKDDYLKVKATWLCQVCVGSKPEEGKAPVTTGQAQPTIDPATDKTGNATLTILLNELREFRAEVNLKHKDIQDNMDKYSEWTIDLGKKIDDVTKTLTTIVNDIDNIRQENLNLKKQVSELTDKVSSLEQSTKNNVIEIQGVPFEENENILTILSKVSEAIEFNFNENMIDYCYRFKSRTPDRPGGIVAKFVRKIDIVQLMQKRKEKKNLNSRDLGFMAGDASVIYVNESLTPAKRKLLSAARLCKKSKHYTYVWVNSGRIFMRKNQGEKAIEIKSEEDLEKLQ